MADLLRETPLFDKFLPIQVIDEENEIRVSTLVFRIIEGTQAASVAGQTEKVFHFEVRGLWRTVEAKARRWLRAYVLQCGSGAGRGDRC